MIVANIQDMRELARRRLPRMLFDFVDGGAGDEVTLRANQDDFSRLRLVPRVLVDVSQRDQTVRLLGQELASPMILAPTGAPGSLWPNGAVEAAKAAVREGAVFCLSTASTSSIEQIAAAITQPWWFQLYLTVDRELSRSFMQRAHQAGCPVLVLTVDLALQGQRDRDVRNGLSFPPRMSAAALLNFASRPGWVYRYLTGPRFTLANFVDAGRARNYRSITDFVNSQFDQSVNWSDIAWVRDCWPGKLVLKGVLHAQDARMACDHGVDGIIVSNHGGRQLDGVPSAIASLPAVVDAVDGRLDVILDGGVRRGTDVVKALALGAKACMVGRPFLYGLAGRGGEGVADVLGIFRREIDIALALLGRTSLRGLDRSVLLGG